MSRDFGSGLPGFGKTLCQESWKLRADFSHSIFDCICTTKFLQGPACGPRVIVCLWPSSCATRKEGKNRA